MKRKGIIFITILFLVTCMLSLFTTVKAATGSMYLNIKLLRNSGYGYKLASNNKNVWKIYETDGNGNDKGLNSTIYCLKGGPGFGSSDYVSGTPQETHYTQYFNLKDPNSITPNQYKNVLPDTSSKEYKALLWILDNCYVAPKTNPTTEEANRAVQDKKNLLNAAAAYAEEVSNTDVTINELNLLTDDDIDAVQQIAVWYYTNPEGDSYHVTSIDFWLNSVQGTENSTFKSMINFGDDGWDRANACQALFDYLVQTPQKADFTYTIDNSNVTPNPIKIADTDAKIVKNGDNYIVGPFRLQRQGNINYSFDAKFLDQNNTVISSITLLDSNKDQTNKSIKNLVGEDFYISVPTSANIESIKLEISGSYTTTKSTYWSVENPDSAKDQPVVKVEKSKVDFNDSKTVIKEEEKYFDLALRKFIISINGQAPSIDRTPQIDATELAKLISGTTTTANKVHTKDPLTVNNGDKVVYKIRVYNEGKIDGYATEITDYLPSGLEFIPSSESTINQTYGWANPSGDGKTIKTSYLADKLITAFNGTELKYLDVEIECKVVAPAQSTDQKLKNIAEITAHKDKDGNENVTDRDSQPNNVDLDNYDRTSQQDDDDFEELIMGGKHFDLALRKFIISINGQAPSVDRTPQVDASELTKLADGTITTVNKVHPKDPLTVTTGDKVIYKIRVYNEGELDGYVTELTDYLPSGLELVPNTESTINQTYGWTNPSGDGKTIKTAYLADKLIEAFNGTELKYVDVEVECKVVAPTQSTDQRLKNIAEITAHKDKDGNETVIDRDSQPNNVNKDNYGTTSQEDDDDFEDLIMFGKYFDLALRKFITAVNNKEITNREPQVVLDALKDGSSTTATYNHPKTPVNVYNGDIVTYTIRVYNEGQLDGYVTEITDHLPQQLEFIVDDELNAKYGWILSEDGRTVKTNITSSTTSSFASRDQIYEDRTNNTDKVLLKAFDGNVLDYIDVKIKCKVKDNISLYEKITNIADITDFTDKNGNAIIDRDSQKSNVVLPTDETLPEYKDTEIERGDTYIAGQQDDDDFEKLILKKFDLALRKFITGVNEKEITNRAPAFTKTSDGKYEYVHPKDPVDVANGNTVIYTLRIFNEGNVAGYAEEVKDNLPEGLEFLPENTINTAFKWKMYKEDGTETTDVKEAKFIKTNYLSKANETVEGNNILKAFDPETMTMPDYKDIKIAFKVTEPNTSDRIIINTAEIADDADEDGNEVDDIDSTPDNNVPEEDDQDIEKIKVKYFDLALKKWVTESIVTYNGKTTVTKTGHTGDENPEPPAKVEIRQDRINKTTVKFKFSIKVTNEGEIEGYAKEIIDYIPEGLKFVAEDNPKWRLTDDGKVLTDQLKDVLIKPGESQTVEIILTWINGKSNMGLKTNWAEIYEDYNEHNSPDIDSTPGNNKKGEDDIDEAPVILTTATGNAPTYATLALASISMIAGGIVLIKKYVI